MVYYIEVLFFLGYAPFLLNNACLVDVYVNLLQLCNMRQARVWQSVATIVWGVVILVHAGVVGVVIFMVGVVADFFLKLISFGFV